MTVRWTGLSEGEATWEPSHMLSSEEGRKHIEEFEKSLRGWAKRKKDRGEKKKKKSPEKEAETESRAETEEEQEQEEGEPRKSRRTKMPSRKIREG